MFGAYYAISVFEEVERDGRKRLAKQNRLARKNREASEAKRGAVKAEAEKR